jgi:ribosome-binding ATPase
MDLGITGLPLTGKTTLFNALTGETAETGGWSSSKDANLSVVKVPDPRIDILSAMYEPKKTTNATIQYADVAGLEKGDATGSRAQFLAQLRAVDALIHVVRAFESSTVPEHDGGVDILRDIEDFELELMLADLEVIERRVDRLAREVKSGRTEGAAELSVLEVCQKALSENVPLRAAGLEAEGRRQVRGFQFLTLKPMIIAINTGEDQIGPELLSEDDLAQITGVPDTAVVFLCAEIEMEISQLDDEDQAPFLEELGVSEPALVRLIQVSYGLLDVISFFTVGEDEVRAWTVRRGALAPEAAGAIHTDLERGFIRAEVVTYDDLVRTGSIAAARDEGVFRVEGKNYTVQDGDILNIRFNV